MGPSQALIPLKRPHSEDDLSGKGCSSCGGLDHQRRSSKTCAYYKPNIKDIHKPEKDAVKDLRTVVVGLRSVLKVPELGATIEDAVQRVTDIQLDVCHLMNGFIIFMLENNRVIPCLKYSAGIMLQFYYGVSAVSSHDLNTRKTVNDPNLEEYLNLFWNTAQRRYSSFNDASGLSQMIKFAALQYSTNAMNHVWMNLPKWFKKWLNYKIVKHIGFLMEYDEVKEIVEYIFNELSRDDNDQNMYKIPNSFLLLLNGDNGDFVFGAFDYVYFKALDYLNGLTLSEKAMKAGWWMYYGVLKKLLKCFSKHNNDPSIHYHDQAAQRGMRLLSFAPMNNFQCKHVMIDTDSLHGLLRSSNITRDIVDVADTSSTAGVADNDEFAYDSDFRILSIEQFRDEAFLWWHACFDFERFETTEKRFSFSLVTDGVKVRFYFCL